MEFLTWLYLRLKNKHHEDVEVLNTLRLLIENHKLAKKNIEVDFIDRICKNHFIEFDMERTPDLNFGFTDEDRNKYRGLVLDVVKEMTKL
jgi:hypothetical protein